MHKYFQLAVEMLSRITAGVVLGNTTPSWFAGPLTPVSGICVGLCADFGMFLCVCGGNITPAWFARPYAYLICRYMYFTYTHTYSKQSDLPSCRRCSKLNLHVSVSSLDTPRAIHTYTHMHTYIHIHTYTYVTPCHMCVNNVTHHTNIVCTSHRFVQTRYKHCSQNALRFTHDVAGTPRQHSRELARNDAMYGTPCQHITT